MRPEYRPMRLQSFEVQLYLVILVNVSSAGECPVLNVSYKPQKISPKSQGTVRQLLHDRIRDAYIHPQFVADVMKPLLIEAIIDQEVGIFFVRTCSCKF